MWQVTVSVTTIVLVPVVSEVMVLEPDVMVVVPTSDVRDKQIKRSRIRTYQDML